jgi:hypothetical protein
MPATPLPAMSDKDWAMLRRLGWIATTAVLVVLVWQIAATEPVLPRAASAVLLVIVSVLAGLRVSADSANAYMKDLQRVNKVLADQNQELQEANSILLEQVSSEPKTSSESACP